MQNFRLALLGGGIAYSKSPEIHGLIAKALGAEAVYDLMDVPQSALACAVARLSLAYDGFNITKPYKTSVDQFMHEFAPSAKCVGAVNTVKNSCGILQAHNTDGDGLRLALEYHGVRLQPHQSVLVLGAGGAARSAVSALKDSCRVYIHNRTPSKAARLAADFGLDGDVCLGLEQLSSIEFDGIINCTTLGLNGEQAMPKNAVIAEGGFAYDTIYSPPITPFLQAAEARVCANGLAMLVAQAVMAWQIWLDKPLDCCGLLNRIMEEL